MAITDSTIIDGLMQLLDGLDAAQDADTAEQTSEFVRAQESLSGLGALTDKEAKKLLPGATADEARAFMEQMLQATIARAQPVAERLLEQARQAKEIRLKMKNLLSTRPAGEMFLSLSANGTVSATSASVGLERIQAEQKAAIYAAANELQKKAEESRLAADKANLLAMDSTMQIDLMFDVVKRIPPHLLEGVLSANAEAIAQVIGVISHPNPMQRTFMP